MRKIDMIRLVLFLLAAPMAQSSLAQSFEYSNPSNPKHTFSIQLQPAFVAAGDRAEPAEFCRVAEGFICVESDWFKFAVPLKPQPMTEWTLKGNEYRVLANEQARFFGREYKALRIQSIQGKKKYTYLYSPENGLLSFSVDFDGEVATFVSERAVGFGAR